MGWAQEANVFPMSTTFSIGLYVIILKSMPFLAAFPVFPNVATPSSISDVSAISITYRHVT